MPPRPRSALSANGVLLGTARPTSPESAGFTTAPLAGGRAMAATASYQVALILSCLMYMACSAGMMIVNKMALKMVGLPITVVMIQVHTSYACCWHCCYHITLHPHIARVAQIWLETSQMAFTVVFLCATPCSLHFGSLKVSHVMVPALYLHRMSCCLLLLCEDGFSYCPADPAARTADPTFTVQFMTTGRAALGRHDTFPVYTHARIFDACT